MEPLSLTRLDRERWRRISEVLARALEVPADRVPGFLAEACADDAELRAQVEELLAADRSAGEDFLRESRIDLEALTELVPSRDASRFHPDEVLETLREALAGRYRIERPLGRGGMGLVFLAEDLKHQRRVAIKVLAPELGALIGTERFLHEIQIAARLSHPHILPLHDSGEAVGRRQRRRPRAAPRPGGPPRRLPFYVMPYVEGESLQDRLASEGRLPLEEALRITREVADALDYAHERGVVHRDIKPGNILYDGRHALVADFGIARAVGLAGADRPSLAGVTVGTTGYMSPEHLLGVREVDRRSDLYSLACVAYEMLAGTPPFVDPDPERVRMRHLSETPTRITTLRPEVPEHVARAIARALSKRPEDRYETARQFAEELADESPLGIGTRRPWMRRALPSATWLMAVALLTLFANPKIRGFLSPVSDIRAVKDMAIVGDRAFIASECFDGCEPGPCPAWLRVLDISNPASPRIRGKVSIPCHPLGVAAAGSHAYIALGAFGVYIVDVSDPRAPTIVAKVDTPNEAFAVDVEGSHAYVADTETGLLVMDVSNPSKPSIVGRADTPGFAWALAVHRGHVYVTDRESGLHVFDISNAYSPVMVASLRMQKGFAADIAVSGDHAYITTNLGLEIIEISNPAAPGIVSSLERGGGWDVAVSGDYAYLPDGVFGLKLVNISEPTSPVITRQFPIPSHAEAVAVSGHHAFVGHYKGLTIVDVRERARPPVAAAPGG